MSRTELKGSMSSNPLVNLTDNVGGKFTGTMISGPREVKTKLGGIKFAYDFAVIEADVDFVKKDGTEYVKVDVNEGDKVTILATGPLNAKLIEAKPGMKIEIEYLGKKKSKKGNQFHDFGVYSVEE